MKTGVIFLASAIGLTGCTTMKDYRSGNWGDSGFPPTYPGDKSEYHPSVATGNISTNESDLHQRSNYHKPRDLAREQRERTLDKLEKSIRKSLPREASPIKFYIVIADKLGSQLLMLRDGEIISQADQDKVCDNPPKTSPPSILPPPLFVGAGPPDYKCYCQKKAGDGDGINETEHHHCYSVPPWWPW